LKISGLDNAVLLLDKPAGITSFDTISRVKRAGRIRKIGHSGTLDKFASGLLVVCTGQATKLTRYFLESDKRYTGSIKLGMATDTCDITGEVVSHSGLEGIDEERVRAAMAEFMGRSVQIPPEYSSLKIGGERASDRARRGEKVVLEGRNIRVYRADITGMDLGQGKVDFDIACSKGTYIRSIARDLGEKLGTGACLSALRRVESGRFSIDHAARPDDVAEFAAGNLEAFFAIDPASALADFGRVVLNESGASRAFNGAFFHREEVLTMDNRDKYPYVIFDSHDEIIAIAEIETETWQINYHSVFNAVNEFKLQ